MALGVYSGISLFQSEVDALIAFEELIRELLDKGTR